MLTLPLSLPLPLEEPRLPDRPLVARVPGALLTALFAGGVVVPLEFLLRLVPLAIGRQPLTWTWISPETNRIIESLRARDADARASDTWRGEVNTFLDDFTARDWELQRRVPQGPTRRDI